ncbi:hypothetical protein JXC34_01160, partial [Candidatus Woesearchaeota archaeon]|nr:hypothetical protein [Candidatus Woesearchaeota archaeon]
MTTQYWFDLSSLYERRKALVYALTFQTMKGIADDYCTLYEKSKNIWSMQGIEHVQNLLRAGVGRFRFGYEQFDLLNRLDIPVLVQELNAESAGPLVERLWAVQGDGSCPEAYATQAAYETEMTSQGWPFYGRSYIHRSPSKGHRPGEKDTGHIYLEHILAHEQVEMTPR